MSKIVLPLAGLILITVGFGLGRYVALEADSPKPPPEPRTAQEVARSIEEQGELRGILMERNVMVRAAALTARLAEWGPDDVDTVATLLKAGAIGLGSPESALLARFWALYEPEEAADWAIMKAPIWMRPIAVEAVIEAWAISDPEAARKMMTKVVSRVAGPVAINAQAAFVRGWFASGQPGIEEYIFDLGPDIPQARNLTTLVQEIILRDGIDAAINYLDDLPDEHPRFKRAAFRAAAPEFVKADLAAARAWCERVCEGPFGEHSRALIGRQWAKQDGGRAALEWISKAPAGAERDRAVWRTFSAWREIDPKGLQDWIDEMGLDGVEPWFYPAVDRVAMWKSWDHPLEAYRWAELIPNQERRERAQISITRRYREVDEGGAEEWLRQSPLSEEAREKARTLPENWHGRGDRPYIHPMLER